MKNSEDVRLRQQVSPWPGPPPPDGMNPKAYEPPPHAEDVRHSRHAVRSWEEKIAQLITAAEAALKASPNADPCNDEPFALQADGYHYWRLRHALEAVIGPLQFDGSSDG